MLYRSSWILFVKKNYLLNQNKGNKTNITIPTTFTNGGVYVKKDCGSIVKRVDHNTDNRMTMTKSNKTMNGICLIN